MARTIYKVQGSPSSESPLGAEPQAPAPVKAAAPQPAARQAAAANSWQPTASERVKRRKLTWALVGIVALIVILAILVFVLNNSDGQVAGALMGPRSAAVASVAAAL